MDKQFTSNVHTNQNQAVRQVPGMAYVPMQTWKNPIPLESSFCKGTIFHDLDKPFCPKGGK